jgi:Bacterial Ig domain
VSGGNFPATPVQQQSWNNSGDGLWRWMPSIAVDQNGNMAIGYSTSSATQEPSIRYAGRLASDPSNDLGQGEAIMTAGGGHQTHSSGRWGDYSMLTIDPADNLTFWHTNEYYAATSSANWFTRIGKFQFQTPALIRLTYNGGTPFVDGTNLTRGTRYTVTAQANANTRSVVFNRDGRNVKTDSAIPFDFTWTPTAIGTHTFMATPWSAIRGTGTSGAPITVHFNVVP